LDNHVGFLFIGTTGDHAGHSLVTWAITRRLVERGFRVGFFKPFGTQRVNINAHWSDPDALLFKETLGIQEPLDRICPYVLSEDAWRDTGPETLLKEIRTLVRELSDNKDVLIIMGADHIFLDNASRGVSDISLNFRLLVHCIDGRMIPLFDRSKEVAMVLITDCEPQYAGMGGFSRPVAPKATFPFSPVKTAGYSMRGDPVLTRMPTPATTRVLTTL
jgi:hypothetical protein